MIIHRNRRTDKGDNSITFVFIYGSALIHDDVAHFCKVIVQKSDKLTCRKKLREAREFLNIGEHSCHFKSLATELE